MSPSTNGRLIEKLKAIAAKRGADSPQAQELAQLEAGEPAEAPKSATEKPKKQENK